MLLQEKMSTQESNIKGLIDARNAGLWELVNKTISVTVKMEDRVDYLCYNEKNKSIIYVPTNNINPASFTHELLHIYLRTKGVYIGGGLYLSIRGNNALNKLFSNELIQHIDNCLDHVKMFPEFLKLGYKAEEFIQDFDEDKFTLQEIYLIREYFVTNNQAVQVYNIPALQLYLGKYFAARSCPNKRFNYEHRYEDLRHVDAELYRALENFMNAWDFFDYNHVDPVKSGYHHFLHDFTEELEKWASSKVFE